MSFADKLFWAFLGLITIANGAVSLWLGRNDFYSRGQKLAQMALIWCLPVFGVTLVGCFLYSQYGWRSYDTRAFPERNDAIAIGDQFEAPVEPSNAEVSND